MVHCDLNIMSVCLSRTCNRVMRVIWILCGISATLSHDLNIINSKRYLTIDEMYTSLKLLAARAPSTVEMKSIGNTYIKGKSFQHEIYLITIGNKKDPILFFDCGIHAREWISPATCLYLIQKLAQNFEANKEYLEGISNFNGRRKKASLFNYQWQFVPMVNPDGYMTTHQKDLEGEDVHRLHRKNRRPRSAMSNLSEEMEEHCEDEGGCEGVDLNRNFAAGWGKGHKDFEADSMLPWTSVYKGAHPISEPESRAIHGHIDKIKKRTLLAISMHSYGKDIYFPKGWLAKDDPDQVKGRERDWLMNFANYFNKALGFRIGSVGDLLPAWELCGGATDDYYWTTQGINLTYTVELDPHINKRKPGFRLPPKKIKGVGRRMWKAVRLMAIKMDQLYPHYKKSTMVK